MGGGGGGWVDLDYNVSSLPNFLFSFFGFRFRRELDNYWKNVFVGGVFVGCVFLGHVHILTSCVEGQQ